MKSIPSWWAKSLKIKNRFEAGISQRLDNIHLLTTHVTTVLLINLYTPVKSYVVKQPQEKRACDFHDDAPPSQCPKWRNIAKKLRFFSKPNWVARINIWIMPVQNLALLSYFGTSKLPISGPNLGCLRQNFSFDFTVVILLSKFLENPNKVRA